ncbi:DMSO/TMAO reductase YedYZ heme-binding membrane subunit [Ruminiclostridium sufflavum DSM 19573]|uniref:DMSO/TMAO reductase YedYZ heme-binding membrane subunit n=1 Tax=Ruminiclostridium sufflavum DSM 19573 TaxID=1121337 RepID=A0A318Y3T4_9FIRM|nr:FMN-binding protein [Ruminiclostridium sufflavum]PYG86681.1 DMSO/TMAO reductase YedYZ heme-binding membrane subunit [Ruminiclostridium sufflavum DSM 19573]
MLFIIALCLASAVVFAGRNFIKKHSVLCYISAAVISAAVFAGMVSGTVSALPGWVNTWVLTLFSRGTFATALFVIVMYTGALPNNSKLIRVLMPVRAELSILASILTLTHNAAYGVTYFKMMFINSSMLKTTQFTAGVITIILLCLMIPLTVTSFKLIRRHMNGKTWKKLQKSAYLFYALIYLHVMFLSVPGAINGNISYRISVVVYSVVFLLYAAMRVEKAWKKRRMPAAYSVVPYTTALVSFALVCIFTLNVPGAVAGSVRQEEDTALAVSESAPSEARDIMDTYENEDGKNNEKTPLSSDNAESPEEEDSKELDKEENGKEVPLTESDSGVKNTGIKQDSRGSAASPVQAGADKAQSKTGKAVKNGEDGETRPPEAKKPEEKPSVSEAAPPPAVKYKYKNGSFSGSGEGYVGLISVNIKIQNDIIKDIAVTKNSEDEPYFSAAKELIGDILSKQSTSVDTVSGATFSSKGIISAVEDALKNAKQ